MANEKPNLTLVPRARGLPVLSVYYRGQRVVKRNRARNPLRAVSRCVEHMRRNDYEASAAEVYDSVDGTLYAVITLSVNGRLTIVFQRELNEREGV